MGFDAWIERMSDQALPAVNSAAQQLDSVAREETSTLSQIGKVIMHDPALTSQVMRFCAGQGFMLAPIYIGRRPVAFIYTDPTQRTSNYSGGLCVLFPLRSADRSMSVDDRSRKNLMLKSP